MADVLNPLFDVQKILRAPNASPEQVSDSYLLSLYNELQSAISSNDPERMRAWIGAAKDAAQAAPGNPLAFWLMALVQQAESLAKEKETDALEASLAAVHPPTSAFDRGVAHYFSKGERRYYESLDPNAHYRVHHCHHPHGRHRHGDASDPDTEVKGETIRNALVDVKYNALTEQQRKEKNIPAPEGADGHKLSEQEQLEKLKKSLQVLEERRIFEIRAQCGKSPEEIEKEVQAATQEFAAARVKIDTVEAANRAIAEAKAHVHDDSELSCSIAEHRKKAAAEKAAREAVLPVKLDLAKQELGAALQQNVINDALELNNPERLESANVCQAPTTASPTPARNPSTTAPVQGLQ